MKGNNDNRKAESYVEKTIQLLEEIKKKNKLDFEVIKVEYVNEDECNYLRVYCDMDQPGGIGSNDCANISRPLSKALDEADYIEDDNYILEVCSPGFLEPACETADENENNIESDNNSKKNSEETKNE